MNRVETIKQLNVTDLPREIEDVAREVIGGAIEVHRELGPGLIERVYEEALAHELRSRSLDVRTQVEISVPYKDIVIGGQRLDMVVNDAVVVELKAVSQVTDLFKAQLLSYLRAANHPLGLLINFNTTLLKQGLHRILNERALTSPQSSRSSRPSRSNFSP